MRIKTLNGVESFRLQTKYCIYDRLSDIMEDIRKAVFFMMTKKMDKNRDQMMVFCMDDMVSKDHLLRLIDRAIDWSFIYDLVF